jgi:hypothetical protein
VLVSTRIDSGDPVLEAFTDQTYAWLEEMQADFERCMKMPFEGGAGILFGNDVLVALHGHEASWALFEVHAFEQFVREIHPDFVAVLPGMLADLAAFTNFLARTGRLAPERASETLDRLYAIAGDRPVLRANRAARRASARARRRMH